MSANEKVIYVAKTAQEANFLKNVLADEGIAAVVHNEAVEGLAGVVNVWGTATRVLVSEGDAIEARRIAMEFDRQSTEAAAGSHSHGSAEGPAREIEWPTCPQCDHPRLVRCPICHTTGDDFEPVDMGFEWIPGLGEQAQEGCGQGGCGCHGSRNESGEECKSADANAADASEGEAEDEPPGEDWAKNMLMCHMCDEPFTAEYAATCNVCGHEFGDGVEIAVREHFDDQLGHRAFLVVGGLLAVAVAVVAYFVVVY